MPEEPYYSTGPNPADPTGDSFAVTKDGLTLAVVAPGPLVGEWTITAQAPLVAEPTNFQAADQDAARLNAMGWVESYVANEQPELLTDG